MTIRIDQDGPGLGLHPLEVAAGRQVGGEVVLSKLVGQSTSIITSSPTTFVSPSYLGRIFFFVIFRGREKKFINLPPNSIWFVKKNMYFSFHASGKSTIYWME